MAPNVPNASAENSVCETVSYVTMASGQCTIGAMANARVWRPVQSVSPSRTSNAPSASAGWKNWPIIVAALALHTSLAPG